MIPEKVIAVFDIGKTNKKLFLFDKQYNLLFERTEKFDEIKDEDGFPCENLKRLRLFIFESLRNLSALSEFSIIALNAAAYGASFVLLDEDGLPAAPLYNYLKPYPEQLLHRFYSTYGGEEKFAYETASPVLGNLNSGMQLYRIKYEKPELFERIRYALHLPQYISYLVSDRMYTDLTSIGCHTNLWHFEQRGYHEWVSKESILEKFPEIIESNKTMRIKHNGSQVVSGIGIHDSSAALVPYLVSIREPFVLISTGTWCISLNPFNEDPLTADELKKDCLCYLQFNGKPVKAARLFAGHYHDEGVKKIVEQFHINPGYFKTLKYNKDESALSDADKAYYQLMRDIAAQQYASTCLVMKKDIRRIFVDGGFSNNDIYMHLLAASFPGIEVYATSMAQATALGTALVIHSSWNDQPIPSDLISYKMFI